MKTLSVLILSFTVLSAVCRAENKISEKQNLHPTPHGDTRMGADAAESGTDITDQDIQAQEDKKGEIKWDSESKQLPIEEEDDLESVQK